MKNIAVWTKDGKKMMISEDLKEFYLKRGFLDKAPKKEKKDK